MLALGVLGLLVAFATAAFVIVQPTLVRLSSARLGLRDESTLSALGDRLTSTVDRELRRGRWTPFTALDLEMAGIATSVGSFLVTVAAGSFVVFVLASIVVGNPLVGLLLSFAVPVVVKVVLGSRATKRRAAFADQLDPTLQLLASALRAGHSLGSALNTTARDSASPTSEEFSRLVNETRIGRDLVDSMHTTADRMDCEDFHWLAEAVAVQRETGGNLNEVIDRVGATIRERHALQREIHTLSAEGRGSAKVLMVLPIAVALMQFAMNPAASMPMFTTSTGHLMLGISGALYLAGILWMRAITNVKI